MDVVDLELESMRLIRIHRHEHKDIGTEDILSILEDSITTINGLILGISLDPENVMIKSRYRSLKGIISSLCLSHYCQTGCLRITKKSHSNGNMMMEDGIINRAEEVDKKMRLIMSGLNELVFQSLQDPQSFGM